MDNPFYDLYVQWRTYKHYLHSYSDYNTSYIILSSGCKDVYDQRSPYDVINLGCVLGLTQDQAHNSITKNCIQSLQHAQVRRVFKSTVQVMTKQDFLNRNTELIYQAFKYML